MKLRPYSPDPDFEEIRSWDGDERAHALWCANLLPYPLERGSMEAKLADMALRYGDRPYMAVSDEGRTVGFFCCSLNPDTNEAMLKFIILPPRLRGRGYGRDMVREAVRYAFEDLRADAVRLNVFAQNTRARHCYLRAGFTERSVSEKAFPFHGEMWDRCCMAIARASVTEIRRR